MAKSFRCSTGRAAGAADSAAVGQRPETTERRREPQRALRQVEMLRLQVTVSKPQVRRQLRDKQRPDKQDNKQLRAAVVALAAAVEAVGTAEAE